MVDRFNLEHKRWEIAPQLNYTRAGHASCSFHLTIYVFGGIHEFDKSTNTIEKLETSRDMPRW